MDVADYDIAPTEIQLMRVGDVFTLNTWKGNLLKPGEGEMLMGQEDSNT